MQYVRVFAAELAVVAGRGLDLVGGEYNPCFPRVYVVAVRQIYPIKPALLRVPNRLRIALVVTWNIGVHDRQVRFDGSSFKMSLFPLAVIPPPPLIGALCKPVCLRPRSREEEPPLRAVVLVRVLSSH